VYTEFYIPGTEPTQPCDVHTGLPVDSLGVDTTTTAPGASPFALPAAPRRDTLRVRRDSAARPSRPVVDTLNPFAIPQARPRRP
jgi:hypothetical protein